MSASAPIIDLVDITAPQVVEVEMSADRKTLWVNINGKCALRCCQIENLEIIKRPHGPDHKTKTRNKRSH